MEIICHSLKLHVSLLKFLNVYFLRSIWKGVLAAQQADIYPLDDFTSNFY